MSRKEQASTWNNTRNFFPKKFKFYNVFDFILKGEKIGKKITIFIKSRLAIPDRY